MGLRSGQRGYTYLLVLFIVAAMGLFAARTGVVWQQVAQREREAELIAVGVEIARALASYARETPVGTPSRPTELAQLVEDKRWPTPRRHLRKVYRDPMTGKPEWGIERDGNAILGVHSLSTQAPIRRDGFPPELGEVAASAASYAEWIFRPMEE